MRLYFLHIIIAGDQFISTLFGGFPDETISSYAYRLDNHGKPAGKILRPFIDWLALKLAKQTDHCFKAYQEERVRGQMPPELR